MAVELAGEQGRDRPRGQSARNRFRGIVTRVTKDGVAAQVEVQSGPHRFVALITREAADELELEPGMIADAVVKATNVGDRGYQRSPDRALRQRRVDQLGL